MEIDFDPAKSAKNARDRGLPFQLVNEIEWSAAIVAEDARADYGERRFVAIAPRLRRLYVICYVIRDAKRRIISFRKANTREKHAYDRATADRR